MPEIRFAVQGTPPAKNEAQSMLGAGHSHAPRVRALLEAARAAGTGSTSTPLNGSLGLEVELRTPDDKDSWDATNYLGGIGDVLEVKSRRGRLDHLGDLALVGLYENDRQIKEVHYRLVRAPEASYTVRIWTLDIQPPSVEEPVAARTNATFNRALGSQMDRVFGTQRELSDQRKKWPWLTGSLGDPFSGIFFVAENPSKTAVEDIDATSSAQRDPNLQWAATRGDRLFREALGRQGFCDGDPMRPSAWHAYITNVMKSPVRAGTYAATSWEAKAETARIWAPVLRWELATAKPRFVVAVGTRTKTLIEMLRTEKLIPSIYDFRSMTHYAYIGQRAEGALGPMHPDRVRRYHDEMATIAVAFRQLKVPPE